MSSLKLSFFGSPQIELNGHPVQLETRKAVAVLAYVAVRAQAQSRETLAAMFWPEFSSDRAFANLRETLRTLKKQLNGPWLDIRRHEVEIKSDPTLWIDICEFQQYLNQVNDHDHPAGTLCVECLSALLSTIDLYQDDFLRGFTLPDSPEFDEWQAFQADLLREQLIKSLKRVVQYYSSRNDFPEAIEFARRWLSHSPWSETAHRELIRLYALNYQRSVALQQYQHCVEMLREEFGAEPEAETRKLYETVLYQQYRDINVRAETLKSASKSASASLHAESGAVAPGSGGSETRARNPPLNNLPTQMTTFIGREAEVTTVKDLLRQPDIRLATLSGAGGSGKTRLGLQVATQLLEDFRDGVFFVSLAPINDAELMVPTIVQTLGLHISGSASPLDILKGYLQQKQLLLLLDNFEQIIAAALMLNDLLAATLEVKVLVTSRTVLRISGEHEYIVLPMKLPCRNALPSFESFMQFEALQLFIERAKAVKRDFTLTEENAVTVAEICSRLDGLPLAIELAAARIKILPPQTMLAKLSSPLQFLTLGARDLPARQQTLRKTIEWSYDLLNEDEKILFRRLAVFVGGWTLEAAETICVIDGDPATGSGQVFDVLNGLESLMDHNMIVQEKTRKERRFGMLETIREYALERLEESEEAEVIRKQHAQFFVLFGKEASLHLNRTPLDDHIVWRERLTTDLDNLRAALAWALEHAEEWRQAAVKLHETLGDLLEFTGQHEEARKTYQETLREIPQHAILWRARLHRKLGKTWEVLNYYEEASQCYDAAESALKEGQVEAVPDWRQEWIEVQVDRIWFHYWQNHLQDMTILTGKVRPIIERDGTATQRARFFNGLTLMGYKRERYLLSKETIAFSLSAVSASRESDKLNVKSMTQFLLGFSYLWGDVLEKAEAPLQAALRLAEDIGDVVLQSRCLTYLSVLYRRRRQVEHVRAYLPRCLDISKTAQLNEYIGMATANLAWLDLQEGNIAEAEVHGRAALDLWQHLQPYHCSFKWLALWPLISVSVSHDRMSEAIEHVQALLHPKQKRLPDPLATILENAIQSWHIGDEESARSQLTQAIQLAQELRHF